MKWIKLSDELPPFNKEIVLLSERGFTRLTWVERPSKLKTIFHQQPYIFAL